MSVADGRGSASFANRKRTCCPCPCSPFSAGCTHCRVPDGMSLTRCQVLHKRNHFSPTEYFSAKALICAIIIKRNGPKEALRRGPWRPIGQTITSSFHVQLLCSTAMLRCCDAAPDSCDVNMLNPRQRRYAMFYKLRRIHCVVVCRKIESGDSEKLLASKEMAQ